MFFFSLRVHIIFVVALLFWRGDASAALGYGALLVFARVVIVSARWLRAATSSYWSMLKWSLKTLQRIAMSRQRCAHCVDLLCVCLDGPIGAGKSTAAHRYTGPVECEQVPPELLAQFQREPRKAAALFQLRMDASRRAALQRTLRRGAAAGQKLVVHDRALLGSRAFAAWNYVCGSLTHAEYTACCAAEGGASLYATLDAQLDAGASPLLVLLFVTPVSVCRERVAKRSGVDASTPQRYLAGLSLMHALLLGQLLRAQRANGARTVVRAAYTLGDGARERGRCACAALGAHWCEPGALVDDQRHSAELSLSAAEAERMAELGFGAQRVWRESEWLRAIGARE